MQQGGSEIRLLISRCQPQQLKIDQEQRKQTMRKLGIALLLGIFDRFCISHLGRH